MPTGYPRRNSCDILIKNLPDEVRVAIDKRCGGPGQLFTPSGRAGWLRSLIYRELGIPEPEPYRLPDATVRLPLHLVDVGSLKPVEELCVLLARKGKSCSKIAQHLNVQQVVPLRGSQRWYAGQVERILTNSVALALESKG